MTLWMCINNRDKYRLPLYVADTPKEMAEKFHVTLNAVYSSASHYKAGHHKNGRFIAVEVDEEGED